MGWHISKALMDSFENSRFSPELVEEYSAANSSDGARSALSSGSPTPPLFLPSDRMTAFSRLSRYGMTFGLLTDDLGEELLTWFREGFPVRTSASPAEAQGSTENGRGSGPKWPGSLAKLDPERCSWKTVQNSLLGDLEEFSETWPDWGTMQDGECWGDFPPAWTSTVSASGFSLMRPTASEDIRAKFSVEQSIRKNHQDGNMSEQLARLFHKKPTPRTSEILMDWPDGWTSLEPLETAKFQSWLDSQSRR